MIRSRPHYLSDCEHTCCQPDTAVALIMRGPFKCPDCAKGFKNTTAVRSHGAALRHNTSQLVVFPCAGCSKEFATHATLLSHSQAKGHGQYGSAIRTSQAAVSAAASGPPSTPAATSNTIPTTTPSTLPHEAPGWICSICYLSFPEEVEPETHYRVSYVHPSCGQCGKGCRTKLELSLVSVHISYVWLGISLDSHAISTTFLPTELKLALVAQW